MQKTFRFASIIVMKKYLITCRMRVYDSTSTGRANIVGPIRDPRLAVISIKQASGWVKEHHHLKNNRHHVSTQK